MPRQYTMTIQGRRALEEELERLRERRQEVAALLASARSQGDISENAEYQEGKYQQGLVEGRIAEVEIVLANAVIVEPKADAAESVGLFTTVTVLDLDFEEELEYTLVPPFESDYQAGKISVESPLGEGLLGASAGAELEIETPGGTTRLRVLALRPMDAPTDQHTEVQE
jgi:transcription elongation factor GreA